MRSAPEPRFHKRPGARPGELLAAALEVFAASGYRAAHDPNWARVYRLVLGEGTSEHPAVFRTFARNGMAPVWELLAEIVEEGQAAGEFRGDVSAPDLVRVLVTGLMQQTYFQLHTPVADTAPADVERMFDTYLRVVLDGLRAR